MKIKKIQNEKKFRFFFEDIEKEEQNRTYDFLKKI